MLDEVEYQEGKVFEGWNHGNSFRSLTVRA